MNSLREATDTAGRNANQSEGRSNHGMEKTIHVLSVGPVDYGSVVHDALLKGPKFRLSIATDYRELWVIPKQELIQVAILHNTLSAFELEDASRFIRQQWPNARILIIRRGVGSLDDALYDDRLAPNAAPELLLFAIERHTGKGHEWRYGDIEV